MHSTSYRSKFSFFDIHFFFLKSHCVGHWCTLLRGNPASATVLILIRKVSRVAGLRRTFQESPQLPKCYTTGVVHKHHPLYNWAATFSATFLTLKVSISILSYFLLKKRMNIDELKMLQIQRPLLGFDHSNGWQFFYVWGGT